MKSGAALRPPYKKWRVLMTSTLASPWLWSPGAAAIGQVQWWQHSNGTSCLNKRGDNPSDLRHCAEDCVNWLSLLLSGLWIVMWIMWTVWLQSPRFSGMRYKRRGVDTDGHVANYVETEQLIHVHSHTLSFVQTRGSVPVFWSQAGYRYNPRPRLEKGQ